MQYRRAARMAAPAFFRIRSDEPARFAGRGKFRSFTLAV
jgi:hypothetical protein